MSSELLFRKVFGNDLVLRNILKYFNPEEDDDDWETIGNLACVNTTTVSMFKSNPKWTNWAKMGVVLKLHLNSPENESNDKRGMYFKAAVQLGCLNRVRKHFYSGMSHYGQCLFIAAERKHEDVLNFLIFFHHRFKLNKFNWWCVKTFYSQLHQGLDSCLEKQNVEPIRMIYRLVKRHKEDDIMKGFRL